MFSFLRSYVTFYLLTIINKVSCNIPSENIETLTTVREKLRVHTKQGLAYFKEARSIHLQEAREKWHHAEATNHISATATGHNCSQWGRRCASRIGLLSHTRAKYTGKFT